MSYRSILTVTAAADSYDLTDLETAKAELNISGTSYDALLERWITEESGRIADYCGRVFPVETLSELFRVPPHRHSSRIDELVLGRSPATTITTVTEDSDAALSASDYEADLGAGLLYRLCGSLRSAWFACKIVVTYQAGFADTPAAVSAACVALIKHRWSARTRDPALRSIDIQGVGQKQWWVGSAGDVGDLPPEVEGALSRYREVRV